MKRTPEFDRCMNDAVIRHIDALFHGAEASELQLPVAEVAELLTHYRGDTEADTEDFLMCLITEDSNSVDIPRHLLAYMRNPSSTLAELLAGVMVNCAMRHSRSIVNDMLDEEYANLQGTMRDLQGYDE